MLSNPKDQNRNTLYASLAMDYLGKSLFLRSPQFCISAESSRGKPAQGSHTVPGAQTMEGPESPATSAAICSSPWASFPLSAHPFHHLLNGNPFYKEHFQINGWSMLLISKLISRHICGETAAPITRVMIKHPISSQLLLLLQTANVFQLTSKENFWYVLKTSPLPFIPISLIRLKTNNRKPSICMHINPASGVLATETESEALPLVLKCISSIVLSYTSGKEGNRVDYISY